MNEQKNPNNEYVASLRLVNGKWHAAFLKNQRMEHVFIADKLEDALAPQNGSYLTEALPEGTRVVVTTIIVLPEGAK